MNTAKLFRIIVLCTIACVSIVVIMYAVAEKPNSKKNGFNRILSKEKIVFEKSIDLKYVGYYFAGHTNNNVYLGNSQSPLHTLKVGIGEYDTMSINSVVDSAVKGAWKYARIEVDSPYVYVADGVTPAFYKSSFSDNRMKKFMDNCAYFTNSIHVSSNSFLAKGVKNKEYVLFKMMEDSPYVRIKPGLLDKQVDGMFCTDGTMIFDQSSETLVYLYRYRNEFVKMDTALNLLSKWKTIDTNNVAKIQIANISSKNKRIFSAPARVVNYTGDISDDRLYVLSALRADNESLESFENGDLIDVYSLLKGDYLMSFRLPRYEKKRIEHLEIIEGKLYTISQHHLRIFDIRNLLVNTLGSVHDLK